MRDWQAEFQGNQALWNELTQIHARAYPVEAFKAGTKQLDLLVRSEVGDVVGKSLLHLQCHFGMDTMLWARLGATVTGIDFSPDAIALARKLSDEVHVPATFIRTNLYDLPDVLHETFDIVFTSWGVLGWLPDLPRWGQIIVHFLKPGGFFYIAEGHPFLHVFYDEQDAADLRVFYPYFRGPEPTMWPGGGPDYADHTAIVTHPSYEWHHPLGAIVDALITAGLRIEFLHEHDVLTWDYFSFMTRDEDGWYRLPPGFPRLPLSFSIKATKR
jgi:SAM-dependent methyltransferase